MKIVTYNVNGLRPRVSQFGSLKKLLDSLDADVICLQETKISRNELRADLVRAEGYESFFSCTRTSEKGRTGYSGVATFCRVKSAFSSNEVALPLSAEEGFTGVLENSQRYGAPTNESQSVITDLNDFTYDELLKIDGEGRCIVTDHGHFVLFNLYGPRAHDDMERVDFKRKFYSILQKRWDSLLGQGKRVFVVGDLNIAPTVMDRCDAQPDFEKNEFRTWFRSLLTKNGGSFVDVFRENHPERSQAFTCWSTNSGAEVFNYGSRIDHMLVAGPCLHDEEQCHSLLACHVKECDILEQFKRWKSGNIPRWKSGKNIKLEGSDHIPVYMSLVEIPEIHEHNTPSLSTRYSPQVYGCQQTLVSMFTRKQHDEENLSAECSSVSEESIIVTSSSQLIKRSISACSPSPPGKRNVGLSCTQIVSVAGKRKAKKSQSSQLSLKSFFQKTPRATDDSNSFHSEKKLNQEHISSPNEVGESCVTDTECRSVLPTENDASLSCEKEKKNSGCHDENNINQELMSSPNEIGECIRDKRNECQLASPPESEASQSSEKDKKSSAFAEWQRIQQLMQTSTPLCKGHKEPCVSRVVKKSGPNLGRRFYVCARAEGPASNPEANCGFFKWANSKSKPKG